MIVPMNPFAVEAKIRDLADRAATEFLSPLSEKRASPGWIAKNAERVLAEAGSDLTPIVAKIASDENLNPHEVARVCEESNKEVFARLYRSSDDKTFEFKVADASRVLESLNRPYDGPGDLFLPVEHPKLAQEKTASAKTASPRTSWAASALYPSEEQSLALSLDEEKTARDAFRELKLESDALAHGAALDFLKIARDKVLEDGRSPDELYRMVLEARPGSAVHEKHARQLLALVALDTNRKFAAGADLVVKIATDLLGEVVPSETGGGEQPSDDLRTVTQEAYEFWTRSPGVRPDELASGRASSGGDPVRFINGRHALFVALDTLIDQSNLVGGCNKGLLVAGDRVNSVARSVVNWTPKSENA